MAIDTTRPFVGFHTRFADHEAVDSLLRLVDEGLAPMGFNHLMLEFNPGYAYRCFPEFSTGTVTYEDCVRIREHCKEKGITIIPLFQCLSHQADHMSATPSGAWPLLDSHPEFMETPDVPANATWPQFYTHSWCASNDDIYQYVFPMMDEIAEACGATTVHIGLDEVFDIGEPGCPRCHGKDKAALFARTVKILHDHLTERGIQTMMWGDRLLNAEALGYQMWEADKFGMWPAFDRTDEVTRDIIICDWHYDLHDHGYPSVGQFMQAGFDVIPSFGADEKQAAHFWHYALEYLYLGNKFGWKGHVLGLLCTHWKPLTAEGVDALLAGIRQEHPYDPDQRDVGRVIAKVVPAGKHMRVR